MTDGNVEISQRVRDLLAASDEAGLIELLEPLHAADIADLLEDIDHAESMAVLKLLGTERAAEVLTELDEHSGQRLLELMTDTEVVSLLEEMSSDDAVDLISALSPEKTQQIGALLPTDERERLEDLLQFEEDTAGGIMEVEKVAVREQATIRDAIRLVRQLADDIENLQNVYVVDQGGGLIGCIPILDLVLHEPEERVTDVMDRQVISVPVDMDQEEVAAIFGKYDEFTLPVVDADNRLVGRITVDDIIDVLEEEASEDIARIAGTAEGEIGEKSPLKISRVRLPWLMVTMLGQLLNAVILSHFSAPIETMFALVFFLPLVIGTAGSTGVQAAVVVVREIALGEATATHVGRRVLRELQVTLLNGLALGALLFALVTLWQRDMSLGLLMWTTLISVTLVSAFMGASLPLGMRRVRIDPAIASGPLISVTSDIIGLVVYMAMSTYYIAHFVVR